MKGKIHRLTIFALGITTGSVISWNYAKKKYEQIVQEEIDSVKETFGKRINETDIRAVSESDKVNNDLINIDEYEEQIVNAGYAKHSEEKINDEPYEISVDEFESKFEYESITLIYYADGVLTTEDNDVVDIEDIIGKGVIELFDDYICENVIYVRNEKLKCDYEILKDASDYADIER